MSKRTLQVGLLGYGLDRPATGISRYTIEIARAISTYHPEIALTLLLPFQGPVRALEYLPVVHLRGTRLLPMMMALGPLQLAQAARRYHFDVVHDPVGIAPFLSPGWPRRSARVVTIHDMVPFVHPETHARLTNLLFLYYMPRTVPLADRVITVSESSKRDIARCFPVDPNRLTRAYCGIGEQFQPAEEHQISDVVRRYNIQAPYILAVGALQARKNLEGVLDAYAQVRQRGFAHSLVLVGPKAWRSHGIFQKINELGLDAHIRLTGFVEDRDLPAIYSGASCFVFPSRYEGFGLPPLEAMACAVPVITSNRSSLPEVVGEAGIMVDPSNVTELAHGIMRVLDDRALASNLRNRGPRQAAQFTWRAAAATHAEVYQAVATSARSGS